MHLAEGVLPLAQAAGWTAAAVPVLAWSIRGEKTSRDGEGSSSVLMAGVTSLLFAVTLLPLPVPVVGATSHICLTPLLALVIGVRRIVWPTFFVLLLQAVFFAHGGLTTLGVNTLTLGFLGPLSAVGLWTLLRRIGADNFLGIAIASGVGGLLVYILDAMVLAAALADAVEPIKTFKGVLFGFAPVQVPLAVLESFVSVGIVRVLATRRPGLLRESLGTLTRVPSSVRSASILLLFIGLSGCSYEGIDGSVFGATAESAGRPPTDSILDLSQGELGLGMSIVILFGLGFIAGKAWERLQGGPDDALPC